jgi:hypothetical protein
VTIPAPVIPTAPRIWPVLPEPELLPVAVRAHTRRVPKTQKHPRRKMSAGGRPRRGPKPRGHPVPTGLLVLDCETTTDMTQALLFGVWRHYRLHGGQAVLVEEGLFHANDLPATHPGAWGVLVEYARTNTQPTDPPRAGMRLLSRDVFVEKVLYPLAYEGRSRVVGFNLPFDLSRLAIAVSDARSKNLGGFSLTLAPGNAEKGYTERRHRPRLAIKHLNAQRSQICFTRPLEAEPGHWGGDFVDLRTLVHALTGRSHSLPSACEAFGLPGKADPGQHGIVTAEYVDYCRQDVAATADLYLAAAAELDTWGLPLTPATAYSPASFAKATLKALGVTPVTERLALPASLLGVAMSAFFGGRAECHIRKVLLPVRHVDFTSTYPTFFSLLGTWDLITAKSWDIHEDPTGAAVQQLLDDVTLDGCFDPAFWPRLNGFALVQPEGHVLPVRARYDARKPGYRIGLNHLTSTTPLWFALPDLVAATLLTGRPPKVLRSVTFAPVGTMDGLKVLALPDGHTIEPRTDDPFHAMTEQRARVKATPGMDARVRDHYAQGLKITSNAGAYGIFAEYNRDPLPVGNTTFVEVFGLDDRSASLERTNAPEDPGVYCCPPIAAVITAAARLALALLERCVTDAGGTWVMADTDSMAIVATENGGLLACPGGNHIDPDGKACVMALPHEQVEVIRNRFCSLNPYDQGVLPGSILKHEADADAWAIAAKRYAFTRTDPDGVHQLLLENEHAASRSGLGHLLDPRDPDADATGWIRELWQNLVNQDTPGPASTPDPEWFTQPTLAKVPVTSPVLHRAMARVNAGKTYAAQVKPFNFLVYAPGATPPANVDPTRPYRLLAPYMNRTRAWARAPWRNQHDPGKRVLVSLDPAEPGTATLETFATMAAAYASHPEPKSLGPDGLPCHRGTRGVLSRRHVSPATLVHIGKEANRLEDREAGLLNDRDLEDFQAVYTTPTPTSWADTLQVLHRLDARLLPEQAAVSQRRLRDILKGTATPRPGLRDRLQTIAAFAAWVPPPRLAVTK